LPNSQYKLFEPNSPKTRAVPEVVDLSGSPEPERDTN
jgi:hypothetical protein